MLIFSVDFSFHRFFHTLFVTMSGSDFDSISACYSDGEAENGLQHANASTAGPDLAQLHARGGPVQRQTDSTQSQSDEVSDLQTQLAAIHLEYGPRHQVPTAPSTTSSRRSKTSSMAAVSAISRSTLASSVRISHYSSNTLPSLTNSSSTGRSGPSISTRPTGSGIGQYYGLEADENDILQLPEDERDTRLQCSFKFMPCDDTFTDIETWDRHCRSHFRRGFPSTASCPFAGCEWSMKARPGLDIWHSRLSHMEEEHEDVAYVYDGCPDKAAIEHLYKSGVIDIVAYKELKRHGVLSEQAVLYPASRREEYRRRR